MAQLSLDDTLGAVFLGSIAAACFYGITVVQTWMYYGRGRGDRLYLKCLVFLLWALDSLHLVFVTHTVYTYAVKDFANFLALEVPVWSVLAQVIVTGVSDLIVRGIFLSKRNWILISTIVVTSLVVFGGSIAFAVKGFSLAGFFDLFEISDILYISLGAGVVADILIAASIVNTGALTSLCALLCLISYATMPNNFVFIAFYFVLPKLFLNSLLATLNARRPLREASASMVSIPLSVTTTPRVSESVSRPPRRYSMRPREEQFHSTQTGLQIQVQTSTELKTDPQSQFDEKYWEDLLAKGEEPVAITV
ncbi:hypothetical protein BV20DRAFT_1051116 [Pilatotrama ljubarskyi]|nr:hypothetical protein BV20DRAFT_1051116 [Pilatotrama ljubarskyi]